MFDCFFVCLFVVCLNTGSDHEAEGSTPEESRIPYTLALQARTKGAVCPLTLSNPNL